VTRILIADDHDVVRHGLRSILEARRDWEVVGEAANGKDAVEKAIDTSPDVAILDYSMPFLSGVEAACQIRERVPRTEILIFTMHDNESVVDQFKRAGVRGYVLKSEAQSHLVRAVQLLAQGKTFFSGEVGQSQAARPGSSERKPLTARERSVLQLIAEGCTNKQVARQLGISLKTVETYRLSLRDKLDLTTTAALVRYAIRQGIAPLDS
jgi:DNA-binding NarL/FixJ family response regulator